MTFRVKQSITNKTNKEQRTKNKEQRTTNRTRPTQNKEKTREADQRQ
jgi:hypothetical protein